MMTQNQIMQKHPPGTNPAHIERMKFHMDHGVNFSIAHNMAQSEGFTAKSGLSGISIHPEYVFAYKNWADEVKTRRKEDLTPRSFENYTLDPDNDGSGSDSLRSEEWWGQKAKPGWDPEFAAMTSELARIRNGEKSYWWTRITQPQFIRTSSEDYFPDWMNVFTKEDGSRVHSYEIVKGNDTTDVLKRGIAGAGISLGNVLAGGIVAYAAIFLFTKVASSKTDEIVAIPFKAIEGVVDGLGGMIGEIGSQFTKRGNLYKSFTEEE